MEDVIPSIKTELNQNEGIPRLIDRPVHIRVGKENDFSITPIEEDPKRRSSPGLGPIGRLGTISTSQSSMINDHHLGIELAKDDYSVQITPVCEQIQPNSVSFSRLKKENRFSTFVAYFFTKLPTSAILVQIRIFRISAVSSRPAVS